MTFRSNSACSIGRCRKANSRRSFRTLEGYPACALLERSESESAAASIAARLSGHVALEAQTDGSLAACFDGYSIDLGKFSAGAIDRAPGLRTGLPLDAFTSRGGSAGDQEMGLLVRRLARRGLLEYRLARSGEAHDQVVIEPQVPGYWPQMPALDGADLIVLSRFAYLRRRGNEMILESPRAGRAVPDRRSQARFRPRWARHPAQHQQAAAAGRISGTRAPRVAGGLPDSVQDRRRWWRWPASQ